jgi:PAS domain S-box-containing protein
MNAVIGSTLEAESRISVPIDSIPSLVCLLNPDANAICFNKRWSDFTGRSFSELCGTQWLETVHPNDRQGYVEALKQALQARAQFRFELRLHRADGEYRHVLNVGAPQSHDAHPDACVSVVVDIHHQKLAEEAFQFSEMRSRAVFGASIGHVAVVDCTGRIIAVNDGWLRFARQRGAPLRSVGAGVNYLEICREAAKLDSQDAAAALDGVASVLDGSLPEFHFEYSCAFGTGERWFEMIVHPLHRREGGAVITHLDISNRRTAELHAQSLSLELAHVGRVATLGELTASFAHELSQPLTAMLNNAQTVKELIAPNAGSFPMADDILSDLITDNLRAAKIVQQLRALLRKGQVRFRLLKLNKAIQDIVELLRDEAILKRVKVRLELDPNLPSIWGERIQLQQVVLNLTMNAFEAMRRSNAATRQLTIQTCSQDKDHVTILVQDTGRGIPTEELNRIFEPFVTTKSAGLGMGLTICRSIVEAHGGEISVCNNPEKGVTFRVVLPAFKAQQL